MIMSINLRALLPAIDIQRIGGWQSPSMIPAFAFLNASVNWRRSAIMQALNAVHTCPAMHNFTALGIVQRNAPSSGDRF